MPNEMKRASYFIGEEEFYIGVFQHGNTGAHTHDFLELVYVLDGSAVHTVNGKSSEIRTGDYFMIDFKMQHEYQCEEGQPVTVVNLLFRPGFIDKTLTKCENFQQLMEHYLIRFQDIVFNQVPTGTVFHDEGALLPLIQAMRQEYAVRTYGYMQLLRCYLIQMIVLTLRSIVDRTHTAPRHACTVFMADYVNQHYMEAVSLNKISTLLNYSMPYLSKRFHEDTGLTFQQYLQQTRILHSCRLLANTDKKVSEVAELVGYADTKFYQEIFKKFMHTTPKAYQKECRSGG